MLSILALTFISHSSLANEASNIQQLIKELFPKATVIGEKDKEQKVPVWPVYQLNEVIGYAFESNDLVDMPGFSGERINLLIGIDSEGTFSGIKLLHHHEPIFLHGLGEQPFFDFLNKYQQHSINNRFIIDSTDQSTGNNTVHFDGISKATVSVIIANDTIVSSALKVAREKLADFAQAPAAQVKKSYLETMSWSDLLANNLVKKWTISRAQIEDGLGSSILDYPVGQVSLDGDDNADNDIITLYYAYLNVPTIGISLFGDKQYQQLMARLQPGEHALVIFSEGFYSYLEADFKPGTVPNQVSLVQNNFPISIRDTNFYEAGELQLLAEAPKATNLHIFRIKPQAGLNPAAMMQLKFIVNFKKNPLIIDSATFVDNYQLPEKFFDLKAIDKNDKSSPLWLKLWQSRYLQIIILVIALVIISIAFAKQHSLTRHKTFFRVFRWTSLFFTLFYIGFYAQGQLSVVNIFTVLIQFAKGFDLTVFLLDPVIFILWLYTFISLFLVGRGLFCGWLCPFGALQEMIGWIGKKLQINQVKIPNPLHRRLLKIKYLILLILLPLAFYSLSAAEKAAEIEPFKTAITLAFNRHWPFVLYATLILAAGLFIHKFYCRYICPLGAGLAILGHFKCFEWLTRRKECGSPCQLCHNRCEINAIKKNGDIDYDECIQCLECIVIIHDPQQCAPAKLAQKNLNNIARN
jgi:NosR/NirI family nitrous oxide reductase transcriptional regulator